MVHEMLHTEDKFVPWIASSKSSDQKYSKSLSWTWNLKFLPLTVNNLFKFQAQDNDLEKKPPLTNTYKVKKSILLEFSFHGMKTFSVT